MADMGTEYHVIILDDQGNVINHINKLWEVEVEGKTIRHKYGELRNIKPNFIVVEDASLKGLIVADNPHQGKKFKQGDALPPGLSAKDAKAARIPKAKPEQEQIKALEARLAAQEARLVKMEAKGGKP